VGFNGDAPALELIKGGEMAATIRQDPYGQGRAAVEAAITLLGGGTIDYSDAETRSIYFPVDVITADNVDEFLK
jgi:ribose transport system substrate-binding protein